MDNSKLKKSFGLAATSVTSLYQTSLKFQEEAYKKGKIDAFNDVIAFCVQTSNGNLKNISQKDMAEFLQLKIAELEGKNPQITAQNTNSFQAKPVNEMIFNTNQTSQSMQTPYARNQSLNMEITEGNSTNTINLEENTNNYGQNLTGSFSMGQSFSQTPNPVGTSSNFGMPMQNYVSQGQNMSTSKNLWEQQNWK